MDDSFSKKPILESQGQIGPVSLLYSISYYFGIHAYSPIVRWVIPVSSICMIWVFTTKNTESSLIFSRNDVLIHNGKENKEATAICFEIRIPKKKNKELLRKVQSKIYEVILLWKRMKKKSGLLIFPNIITEQWGYCPNFVYPKLIFHNRSDANKECLDNDHYILLF